MGDISKYTVGYDIEAAANKAKAMEKRIDSVKTSIHDNKESLFNTIDSFWSGQSCNNFKSNLNSSLKTIKQNIEALGQEVSKMIKSSADQMADVDASAVTKNA